MVRRQVKRKSTATRRVAEPAVRHVPAFKVEPVTMAMMKARFESAGRKLHATGSAAGRVARTSMREMTGVMKASREPMAMLLRNFRLAGRRIVRDASAAWHEVAPARGGVLKDPVARPARRSPA
jgi:hypothetical protein